jgi:molybdopterin-guanine dinucleotide biosynthesis protein A
VAVSDTDGNEVVAPDPAPLIHGAVLIGGGSRRMGRAKQCLEIGRRALAEVAVAALEGQVERVFLVGGGPVPDALRSLERLADPPGIAGPMAGVLAALQRAPDAAWTVAACDMPLLSPAAVRWLLSCRRRGIWAVLPRPRGGVVEPMLAVYEPRARLVVERFAAEGKWGLRRLAGLDGVSSPSPPLHLLQAWQDVNTPEQFRASLDLFV